jgi:DNA-binding PadR family transcriptional regulator
MSVPHALLALLSEGPKYGLRLQNEFEARTGEVWPLNVGQVYTTLDRLERDGLVESKRVKGAGHVAYAITPKGKDELTRWLKSAELPSRDDFAMKLALAMTLPGVDPRAMIAAQRSALRVTIDRPEPKSFTAGLLARSEELRVEADLRWLDQCEQLLDEAQPFPPDTDTPKRGRPKGTA